MPWQRQVADVALEVDPATGLYVYSTVIVTVQRQAGKTALVLVVSSHRCLTKRNARVWYTAQTGKDAGEWMREEAGPVLGESPVFVEDEHYRTRMSQGSESVLWLPTRSTFRVFAPLRDGLHGKQSDLVFVDEAWAHDERRGDELKQAIRPTQATRAGAQVWPMSAAGDADSAYLASSVELGRAGVLAGRTDGVAYFEWGIPEDVDPSDIPAVAEHHPAVGFTIGVEALYAAWDDLGEKPGEFARAYGNRWTLTAERIIPADSWEACRVPVDEWEPPEPGQVALAFEVAIDRRDATILAAWRDAGGLPYVDVLDHRAGTGWLAGRFRELVEKWRPVGLGYNGVGPGVDVADDLQRAGLELLQPVNTREYVAACTGLLADVVGERLRHPGHPALDTSAESAAKREVGEAWVWGAKASAGSISALAGATVARWTFDHAPEPAPSPVVVVSRRGRKRPPPRHSDT